MKKTYFAFIFGLVTVAFSACNNYEQAYNELVEQNAVAQKRLNQLEEEDRLVRGEYSLAIETLNSI